MKKKQKLQEKQSGRNPSLQCCVCGQWKRLHGRDEKGLAIQRFHACCGDNGEFEHVAPVCDECCENGACPYRIETLTKKEE